MRSFSFFLVVRSSSNPFLLILSFCDFVSLISDAMVGTKGTVVIFVKGPLPLFRSFSLP